MMQRVTEDEARDRLRRSFNDSATRYDRARPDYPQQLFDDLFTLGHLEPGTKVLEIGCGTGQASRPLAQRGCQLICVELGAQLAGIARANLAEFPLVEVINASFDTWQPPTPDFDMVFSAASWHWLNPATRYGNAARVLKSGGRLAMVNSRQAFPDNFDPLFTDIQACYSAIGEGLRTWPPPPGTWPPRPPERTPDDRGAIEASGLFENVCVRRYVWAVDYTADLYIDLIATYSKNIAMNPSRREKLFAEIRRLIDARPGGQIRKHNLSILHIATRSH